MRFGCVELRLERAGSDILVTWNVGLLCDYRIHSCQKDVLMEETSSQSFGLVLHRENFGEDKSYLTGFPFICSQGHV